MESDVYKRHIENEKKHWWFVARREIIFSQLCNIKKKKIFNILDFGAGSGTNIEILTRLGNVDVYESNIKMRIFLKNKYKKNKKVKIINKIKKRYDLVLAADVVEHIKNDKQAIQNFYNFLKKNGHILITVPAFNFLFSNKDITLKHFRRYKKSNIRELLNKNFKIKKLSYFNFFLFLPIALSILILKVKKTKFIKFAETTPINWVNITFKNIFLLEKYLLRFLNFPFGISIIALAKKND